MSLINEFISYLLSQKKVPSRVTVKNYRADVKQFVRWYEEKFQREFDPSSISNQMLQNYKEDKISFGVSERTFERHLSSLRKFFSFLKLEGYISHSPFELTANNQRQEADPWKIRDFKNYLYVCNASKLTIKNYVIDIKQFLDWAEEVTGAKDAWQVEEKNVFNKLNNHVIEEYKNRLVNQGFSPLTVNRKLSSLRRYLSWADSEQMLKNNNLSFQNHELEKKAAFSEEAVRGFASQPVLDANDQRPTTNDQYSRIPPVRLTQKAIKGLDRLFVAGFISPLVGVTKHSQYLLWRLRGKEVFKEIHDSRFKNQEDHKSSIINLKSIGNISKSFYDPLNVSINGFPWYKKAYFHARYTRPNWYKRYHSYPVTHYFHFALLIIFISALTFGFYNSFILKPQMDKKALAAVPTAPPRIMSFQGRLTDSSDVPISGETPLRFAIYNSQSASGAALLWEEIQTVNADQDGIFSIYLGANEAFPSDLFENNALWLGVTVQQTDELQPRQQLATVAYAANAESLQGLLPITAGGAGTTNVVLALDSSGNLTIGGSATPTFAATGGMFTLSGRVLNLTTATGSNTNVLVNPDGLGKIDLQKPLQNNSLTGNITTAAGAVEVDDLFSILATSSGQSAFTLNQTGGGPLISASASGVQRFTVSNAGTVTAGTMLPLSTNNYDLGSSSLYWNNLYVNNIIGGNVGVQGYWQRTGNAISPVNITDDVLLGATSTSSAYIKLSGTAGNNSWINTGNFGIGTTNPTAKLTVGQSADGGVNPLLLVNTRANEVGSTNEYVDIKFNFGSDTDSNTAIRVGKEGDYMTSADQDSFIQFGTELNGGSNNVMRLTSQGNVGIGTTNPFEKIHLSQADNAKLLIQENTETTGDTAGLVL